MADAVEVSRGSERAAAASAVETETGLDTPSQPIASLEPEKFIPVDRQDIIDKVLEKQFTPEERPLAAEVIKYMAALRQVETARTLDELVELYDPFNPDDETFNTHAIIGPERRLQLDALKAKVIDLVVSANYVEITQSDLRNFLKEESIGGVGAVVDLSEYDFHLIYYRGHIKDQLLVPSWWSFGLIHSNREVDSYRRLFIGLKLKPVDVRVEELMEAQGIDRRKAARKVARVRGRQMLEGVSEHTLHIKIFRRIPRHDLRTLFPNAQIKFNLFDRLWLWVGSGGSTAFAMVTAGLKFLFAVVISPVFFLFTVAGAIGAIVRSVTNFFNTRTRYMAKLAKSLYFHNLASNQSVLTLLSDDAEEEDIKEAVLTYALLLRHGHRGLSQVKYEAEKFLRDEFDVVCDFDIEDGSVHLRRLGLLTEDAGGAPHIRDLDDAHTYLIERWRAVPSQ